MVSDLDVRSLERIIKRMIKIRVVEEMIADKYSEKEMRCPLHLSIGQEAVPSVISEYMDNEDLVVSTHRSHAHYIAKGGDIEKMIFEIHGKEEGCSMGRGGSMHLTDQKVGFICSTAIVGNTIPIGVGLAFKKKIDAKKNFVCIYLGDGAVEEGVFYESVNFAAIHKLPCLFICENNLYSVYTGLKDRQPEGRKIYEMVAAMGLKSTICDGNNVEAIDHQIKQVIKKLKQNPCEGPFFIEFMTYRWREHCGPNFDDELGYRDQDITKSWLERDPIKIALESTRENNYYKHFNLDSYSEYCRSMIEDIFAKVKAKKFPDDHTLLKNVYRTAIVEEEQ